MIKGGTGDDKQPLNIKFRYEDEGEPVKNPLQQLAGNRLKRAKNTIESEDEYKSEAEDQDSDDLEYDEEDDKKHSKHPSKRLRLDDQGNSKNITSIRGTKRRGISDDEEQQQQQNFESGSEEEYVSKEQMQGGSVLRRAPVQTTVSNVGQPTG